MALFDIFRKKDDPLSPANKELLNRIIEEALQKKAGYALPALTTLDAYNELKVKDDGFQKNFLYTCIDFLQNRPKKTGSIPIYTTADYDIKQILTSLMSLLIRRKTQFTDEELLNLSRSYATNFNKNEYLSGIPYRPLLTKIESNIRQTGLSPDLTAALQLLIIELNEYPMAEFRAFNEQINYLLQGAIEISADHSDPLGAAIIEYTEALTDEKEKENWSRLIKALIETEGKSAPTEKWLKEVKKLIVEIGEEQVIKKFENWLNICATLLKQIHKTGEYHFTYLTDINHDILKGIIWSCGILNNPDLNILIDEYGLLAFKKLSGVGAISVRTGNACLFSFSLLPVQEGISRLTKFRMKIKYPSVIKQVDKHISSVAKKMGYSKDQLEEIAVPDFGIVNGIVRRQTGDYTAVIEVKDIYEVTLHWEHEEKKQSSVPLKIKTDHKEELTAIKKLAKEIEALLPVQRDRIEKFYLRSRTWAYEEWYAAYITQPLMKIISSKLIWHFYEGEKKTEGIFSDGEILGLNGQPIKWLNNKVSVQLWHPIGFSSDTVLRWREFLEAKEIRQPFKQAYREVYIVTEAELNTSTYSNRFAAHILRQHQFTALCKQRGWHYTLMGNWDSHNTPYIDLPLWNIRAEFAVDTDWREENTNGAGIFNYISTDQVRFYNETEQIRMEDVPAMVFTEIMRDVDLYVGVTSIGNDATWQDSGDQNQNTYWRNYSFADLTESAKIREQVLKRLVPRLKISEQCSFDGKYLVVKGKLRTYKIHIGSGNILMSPNDQYLCIVKGKEAKTNDKVYLPFEGDTMLSVIISKALLLAEDDKIKDTTITSQINR